jgi:hypothetical protein
MSQHHIQNIIVNTFSKMRVTYVCGRRWLIAENVRLDKEYRFVRTFNKYLRCCSDEKFITARQAIQGLETILKTTDKFNVEIKQSLANLQLSL